jgi:gluconolactonase
MSRVDDTTLTHQKILRDGLMFPEGPVACDDGSILLVEIERKTISRVFPNGGLEVVVALEGGPNGLSVGPGGAIYVCNNGGFLFTRTNGIKHVRPGVPEGYIGGWIERVDPVSGESVTLYDHCGEHRLVGPNDLVFDRHGGFYFTDFGKFHDRFRPNGGLYYAKADGSCIVEVAYPMFTPNGVGLSPDGAVVYVAESETCRLWAFDLEEPGLVKRHPFPSPHGGRIVCSLPGYQRFDSLAVDNFGNVCAATLMSGCISVISPSGQILRQAPTNDPFTTNICFGGLDMKTAYITLSGTGKLISMDWPDPGLRLPFNL